MGEEFNARYLAIKKLLHSNQKPSVKALINMAAKIIGYRDGQAMPTLKPSAEESLCRQCDCVIGLLCLSPEFSAAEKRSLAKTFPVTIDIPSVLVLIGELSLQERLPKTFGVPRSFQPLLNQFIDFEKNILAETKKLSDGLSAEFTLPRLNNFIMVREQVLQLFDAKNTAIDELQIIKLLEEFFTIDATTRLSIWTNYIETKLFKWEIKDYIPAFLKNIMTLARDNLIFLQDSELSPSCLHMEVEKVSLMFGNFLKVLNHILQPSFRSQLLELCKKQVSEIDESVNSLLHNSSTEKQEVMFFDSLGVICNKTTAEEKLTKFEVANSLPPSPSKFSIFYQKPVKIGPPTPSKTKKQSDIDLYSMLQSWKEKRIREKLEGKHFVVSLYWFKVELTKKTETIKATLAQVRDKLEQNRALLIQLSSSQEATQDITTIKQSIDSEDLQVANLNMAIQNLLFPMHLLDQTISAMTPASLHGLELPSIYAILGYYDSKNPGQFLSEVRLKQQLTIESRDKATAAIERLHALIHDLPTCFATSKLVKPLTQEKQKLIKLLRSCLCVRGANTNLFALDLMRQRLDLIESMASGLVRNIMLLGAMEQHKNAIDKLKDVMPDKVELDLSKSINTLLNLLNSSKDICSSQFYRRLIDIYRSLLETIVIRFARILEFSEFKEKSYVSLPMLQAAIIKLNDKVNTIIRDIKKQITDLSIEFDVESIKTIADSITENIQYYCGFLASRPLIEKLSSDKIHFDIQQYCNEITLLGSNVDSICMRLKTGDLFDCGKNLMDELDKWKSCISDEAYLNDILEETLKDVATRGESLIFNTRSALQAIQRRESENLLSKQLQERSALQLETKKKQAEIEQKEAETRQKSFNSTLGTCDLDGFITPPDLKIWTDYLEKSYEPEDWNDKNFVEKQSWVKNIIIMQRLTDVAEYDWNSLHPEAKQLWVIYLVREYFSKTCLEKSLVRSELDEKHLLLQRDWAAKQYVFSVIQQLVTEPYRHAAIKKNIQKLKERLYEKLVALLDGKEGEQKEHLEKALQEYASTILSAENFKDVIFEVAQFVLQYKNFCILFPPQSKILLTACNNLVQNRTSANITELIACIQSYYHCSSINSCWKVIDEQASKKCSEFITVALQTQQQRTIDYLNALIQSSMLDIAKNIGVIVESFNAIMGKDSDIKSLLQDGILRLHMICLEQWSPIYEKLDRNKTCIDSLLVSYHKYHFSSEFECERFISVIERDIENTFPNNALVASMNQLRP